jgi:hypothetical protein
MGYDFVYGLIHMMDGEKDPRCLMLAFTILPVMSRYFELLTLLFFLVV